MIPSSSLMFSGSLVAIVTPMHAGRQHRLARLGAAARVASGAGTSGIVVGGTTGESATLTDAELLALVERARTQLGGARR